MTDKEIRGAVLALKIRRARRAKKWSCAQLDIAMGWAVKNEKTSKVERGIRQLKFVEVEDIARHLRVGIAKFQTIRKVRATQEAAVRAALAAKCRLVRIDGNNDVNYRLEDSQKREQPVSQRLARRLIKKLRVLSKDPKRGRTYYGI